MAEAPTRILVVDDEAPQLKALCDTLRAEGFEISGFGRPGEALAALAQAPFDLILSDLMMPEMDGISLLRAARAAAGPAAPTGIIMTGAGTISTAVEAMKAGAFDYILKPFRLSMVLPVIARATAMRRLEQEKAALEQKVRERTEELETANRELEAFSYSVSHDLRAPLRHITGFSEILMTEHAAQLPADGRSLVESMGESARRMSQLVEDLLQFSRLGRQPLTRGVVSLSQLVAEVLEELSESRAGRKLEVRVGELPDVSGDASLLRQVYINLLSNAIKFTRETDPALIEVGSRQENGARVYFVRDNGAGFAMADAGKLFTPFQRLHRRERFDGTGIGLSIVHNIIRRHEGRIWAEAEVGRGAAFYFVLPP